METNKKERCYRIISDDSLEIIGRVSMTEKMMKQVIDKDCWRKKDIIIVVTLVSIMVFCLGGFTCSLAHLGETSCIDSLRNENEMLLTQIDELSAFCVDEKINGALGKFIRISGNGGTPTIDSIYSVLECVDAWYPDYIVAQAILESATFTSDVFKENNNLFGMRPVSRRSTTQTGKKTDKPTYGHYKNWQLCVLDRVLWDMFRFKEMPTIEEYEKAIMQYAEDTEYISKIRKVMTDNEKKKKK